MLGDTESFLPDFACEAAHNLPDAVSISISFHAIGVGKAVRVFWRNLMKRKKYCVVLNALAKMAAEQRAFLPTRPVWSWNNQEIV